MVSTISTDAPAEISVGRHRADIRSISYPVGPDLSQATRISRFMGPDRPGTTLISLLEGSDLPAAMRSGIYAGTGSPGAFGVAMSAAPPLDVEPREVWVGFQSSSGRSRRVARASVSGSSRSTLAVTLAT